MAAATAGANNEAAAAAAALSELTALLSPSSPAAPQAAEAALALSGSAEGRALLAGHPAALSALAAMAAGASGGADAALAALVNASAEPVALEPLLAALPALLPLLPSSGAVCGVAANLSRDPRAAPRVLRAMGGGATATGSGAEATGSRATATGPGAEATGSGAEATGSGAEATGSGAEALSSGAELLLRALNAARPPAELGALLCNLSQAPEGRRALLDRRRPAVPRLLALLRRADSAELRRGVVGALRNCCFEHEHHEWLLGEEVDVLPFLLLPLAGPEELPEEEMEQLPLDLQYLPPEHRREEQPEIRKMLLEMLLLLAATRRGRILLRSRGSYLVLRELHGWEENPEVLSACQKLIQVLIGDEPEAGMENLLEVTIPEDLEQRLQDMDREEQREWGKEQEKEQERREKEQEGQGEEPELSR